MTNHESRFKRFNIEENAGIQKKLNTVCLLLICLDKRREVIELYFRIYKITVYIQLVYYKSSVNWVKA